MGLIRLILKLRRLLVLAIQMVGTEIWLGRCLRLCIMVLCDMCCLCYVHLVNRLLG